MTSLLMTSLVMFSGCQDVRYIGPSITPLYGTFLCVWWLLAWLHITAIIPPIEVALDIYTSTSSGSVYTYITESAPYSSSVCERGRGREREGERDV